jgi:hypothetical protein
MAACNLKFPITPGHEQTVQCSFIVKIKIMYQNQGKKEEEKEAKHNLSRTPF